MKRVAAGELALATGHIAAWLQAATRQAQRVDEERKRPAPNWAEVEAMLFALALRDLVRAAEYAKRFEPERVGAALDRFDSVVPNARDVRNVLEHFDDYESGTGRLQKKRGRGESGLLRWYEHDGERYSLVFVTAGQELRLDVHAAQEAAERLAGDVLAALHSERA